ncbi:MAG TPA: nucleoside hydrolase [Cyclobacteriaceae bacterium]|nr:nucleoside hydrolase [Cyclobacteriaceae bacterium]
MRQKIGLLIGGLCIISLASLAQSPLKVILDTDIDSDVDDVGAVAMLHTLADHQVIEILGMIVTSDDKHAPSCTDALNHYFGRPDIPIGVEKGIKLSEFSKYTKQISAEFEHNLASYDDAEDATGLYRRLLSMQPDSSVVIISIGHLTNIRKLMESKPDQHSELTGMELIQKKVKLWSCMGGTFPEGKEANFYRPDPESTRIAVKSWPGEVVFAGWEIGNSIITGADYLKKAISTKSPVWRAYQLYNNFAGRPSWDQASILYAISPSGDYWDVNNEGFVRVEEDGSNKWVDGKESNHGYLVEKMNPGEVAKVIDALMIGIYQPGFGE